MVIKVSHAEILNFLLGEADSDFVVEASDFEP